MLALPNYIVKKFFICNLVKKAKIACAIFGKENKTEDKSRCFPKFARLYHAYCPAGLYPTGQRLIMLICLSTPDLRPGCAPIGRVFTRCARAYSSFSASGSIRENPFSPYRSPIPKPSGRGTQPMLSANAASDLTMLTHTPFSITAYRIAASLFRPFNNNSAVSAVSASAEFRSGV